MSTPSFKGVSLISIALALGGCASIVGSSTQTIPITSAPIEASISVVDEMGVEVFKGSTPASVTLEKHAGGYWAKKSYTVSITKPGFKTQTIPITARANGWYVLGNLVFGGAIGWFAVDPFNGKMYTLSPDTIATAMTGETAHNNKSQDGSISVVLLQDVPAKLRDKLVAVN